MAKYVPSKNNASQCESIFTFVINDLKRIKTDDKTKLSNRRRRFTLTIIDSALIFYKVAALQCTAFD